LYTRTYRSHQVLALGRQATLNENKEGHETDPFYQATPC